jgi:septum formation protein
MTNLKALEHLNAYDIILASKSPRRRQLLSEIGLKYRTVNLTEMDEIFPADLKREEIPLYLAHEKADHYKSLIKQDTLLITADTIVWLNDEVIGKPSDEEDAVNMLMKLSGNMHEVFTGVCIKTITKESLFYGGTKVFFRSLSEEEIRYYVKAYKPLDKAGAYGVQEWIGYVGVEHIEGSYYNVMGLPLQKLYSELMRVTSNE